MNVALVASVIAIAVASGCRAKATSTPHDLTVAYLDAVEHDDPDAAYDLPQLHIHRGEELRADHTHFVDDEPTPLKDTFRHVHGFLLAPFVTVAHPSLPAVLSPFWVTSQGSARLSISWLPPGCSRPRVGVLPRIFPAEWGSAQPRGSSLHESLSW